MISPERLIACLDLTTLSGDETEEDIAALCERAAEHGVAAVCVYGEWVQTCVRHLDGTPVKVATVTNFPEGLPDPERAARETAEAIQNGADEVDVVFPFGAFLAGEGPTLEVLTAARRECNGLLKVILESGRLGRRTAEAARDALACGADFLKTSTGKLQPGATPDAARAMIGAGGGFKASGGVRTHEQAAEYAAIFEEIRGEDVTPDTFRIGASALLDELLAVQAR
jgi:deoxyribose-phosphate aldolase